MASAETQATCVVRFGAEGPEAVVSRGATILDAARKAGVYINSLCGGDGVCGKCRVIVREGQVVGGGTSFLTREEIREGYILACEACVETDLLVEVPPEARLQKDLGEKEIMPRRRLKGVPLRERRPDKLDPLVKKVHLSVATPTLDNNEADLERLEFALRKVLGPDRSVQMGLKAIRTIPSVLRESGGDVTATIGYRGPLSEITEVVAGDRSANNLAAVVDVGTTTVVVHLVDLCTGQTLETAVKYNSQTSYGADVIGRIIWCDKRLDGLPLLHEATVSDINSLIGELEMKMRVSRNDISVVVAAGNTTMMHLLLGLDPKWIRREPYIGVAHALPPFRAAEVGLTISPRGLLYCLPSVSAFVGADVTAGVIASGLHESDTLSMLIDIGTNGEIVIGNKDWLVCASASAGPAFEGAGNRDGMRATLGAIDHVRGSTAYQGMSYSTVGDAAPVGFCGTAYIDLLAELLVMGIMDKTGRLDMESGSDRLRIGENDIPEFVVVRKGNKGAERDLVITQDDISNLVRTKGAIYAAARVLLRSLGLSFSDLDQVMVAGAFGNYLDLESAVTIGLLPDLPSDRLRFVGNSSVAGAKMAAIDAAQFDEAKNVAESMTYFELSTDPSFMDEFTQACFFPHTNIQEFPTVMSKLERV